ncbi:aspartic peptidase domain-containing protein [Hysterangium stoloniferum]|nr:aspartic peptidase domain-containing protein [Hysterangium stoloniferum]
MRLPRDGGDQVRGEDGAVLNMTLSGDGVWNSVYSVPVTLGKNGQQFYFSVDTGSSDIWIASRGCSTSECNGAHASLYDPSDATQTGQTLTLNYLQGAANGPIVWDDFMIGPYNISSQAFVAATDVTDEPLAPNFVGLLGLALPPNSRIAEKIPPTISDSPDGATLQENLFGLTPINTAPTHRFFGISLERPGSSRIPSLLAIGKHPENLIPGFDPSNATLVNIISSRSGDLFWRVSVDSITGWVDGIRKPIVLDRSEMLPGTGYPVALVDTGGSIILATRNLANAIYGAWGIGPAQDGNYYMPCTTPMNISIGLGGLSPISIHPLDMTAFPPGTSPSGTASTCQGVIQADDSLSGVGDIVLGVPFMRNVYAILSSSNGSGTDSTLSHRLGLVPLTDPTVALQEFHNVRVLGESLDPNQTSNTPPSDLKVGKKLSVGITIIIAIIGFFVLCGLLFGIRFWLLRRKFKRGDAVPNNAPWEEEQKRRSEIESDGDSRSGRTRIDSSYNPDIDVLPRTSLKHAFPSAAADMGLVEADGDYEGHFQSQHVRTASQLDASGTTVEPLLDHDHDRYNPWANQLTAPQAFEEFGSMAGVGARNSVVSTSSGKRRTPRVRLQQEEERERERGSYSSTKTYVGAEVGEIFDRHNEVPAKDAEDMGAARLEPGDAPQREDQ